MYGADTRGYGCAGADPSIYACAAADTSIYACAGETGGPPVADGRRGAERAPGTLVLYTSASARSRYTTALVHYSARSRYTTALRPHALVH